MKDWMRFVCGVFNKYFAVDNETLGSCRGGDSKKRSHENSVCNECELFCDGQCDIAELSRQRLATEDSMRIVYVVNVKYILSSTIGHCGIVGAVFEQKTLNMNSVCGILN